MSQHTQEKLLKNRTIVCQRPSLPPVNSVEKKKTMQSQMRRMSQQRNDSMPGPSQPLKMQNLQKKKDRVFTKPPSSFKTAQTGHNIPATSNMSMDHSANEEFTSPMMEEYLDEAYQDS
ncbi:uncharacterized protein [Prorops nasuta]|uniref:uncharacterized protein n=1 Tax=Prorops nasuta TaxID=863751 RepID=UPI0034CE1A8C